MSESKHNNPEYDNCEYCTFVGSYVEILPEYMVAEGDSNELWHDVYAHVGEPDVAGVYINDVYGLGIADFRSTRLDVALQSGTFSKAVEQVLGYLLLRVKE